MRHHIRVCVCVYIYIYIYYLVAKSEGRDHLGDIDIDDRIILNWAVSDLSL